MVNINTFSKTNLWFLNSRCSSAHTVWVTAWCGRDINLLTLPLCIQLWIKCFIDTQHVSMTRSLESLALQWRCLSGAAPPERFRRFKCQDLYAPLLLDVSLQICDIYGRHKTPPFLPTSRDKNANANFQFDTWTNNETQPTTNNNL